VSKRADSLTGLEKTVSVRCAHHRTCTEIICPHMRVHQVASVDLLNGLSCRGVCKVDSLGHCNTFCGKIGVVK
jgi:hypothetical protein